MNALALVLVLATVRLTAPSKDAIPLETKVTKVSEPIVIEANTQATVAELRIAAFNIRDEAYKDDTGAVARGLTAALQIFVKDDDAKNQKLRVHAGQTIAVAGKTLVVVGVDATSVKITLR